MRLGRSASGASRKRRAALLATAIVGAIASTPSAGQSPRAASEAQPVASTEATRTTGTGAPLPRFASLKSDRVHLRQGPGTDHKVLWVYTRAGLPIEIVREFEGWRQVRDSEGATGWVAQSLVSGRRTAIVLAWERKAAPAPQLALLADDRDGAAVVVMVEAGVIANVRTCDGRWCYVSVGQWRGYVEQRKLWGVYADEVVR